MHQCSVCSKSFPSASKLERHHFTHTGQKPFTCSICGKGFRQSVHLKKHTETHTGKSNPWSFPSDSIPHSAFTNTMEPAPTNQDEPSPEKSGHGFNIYSSLSMPPSRLLFPHPQPEETKERPPLQMSMSHPEIRHQPEHMPPLLDNSFVSQQNILPNGQFLPNPVFHDNMLSSAGVGAGQASAGFWHTEQRQTDKRHTCTVCLKSFNSSYHLQRHIPTHSQLKPFECDTCGKAFKQRAHLKAHSQSHHVPGAPEGHPAPESQQQGPSAGKMRVNHQCPTCLKTFCSPSKLKRHFMIHTGQKPYSCGDCGKSFRQVWHLKTHLYAHRCAGAAATDVKSERSQSANCASASQTADEDDLKLSDQGDPASTSVEMELRSEVRVSTPPDGDQAAATSQDSTDVKVEQQAHYQCSICSKTFGSLSKHRQHYMTHKELRPFQCQVCNRAFRLAVHLKRHQISHKNQEVLGESPGGALLDSVNPHRQPDSGMSSQLNDGNATAHLSVKPENRMPNPDDDHGSPTRGAEATAVSDQQAASGQADGQNQKIGHRPHQCPTCLKSFPSPSKLQRHMMTHTGQRPFGCETCGKRFRQLSHLRIHSRTHLWAKYYKQRLPHAATSQAGDAEHDAALPGEAPQLEQELQKLSGPDASVERPFGQPDGVASGWIDNSGKKRGFQRSTPSPFRPQRKTFASTRQRHYNCGDCGKVFTQVAQLKVHTCSGHGLPNKVGLDCGAFLPQPTPADPVGLLKSNNLSKTPGKKRKATNPAGNTGYTGHQCLICCKYFPSFSKLERHSRVHTGLRPFQCLACGKTFRQASHLTVHERTHNKFGPLRPTSQAMASNVNTQRQPQQQPLYPKIHVQAPLTSSAKTDPRHSNNTKECERQQCKYEDPFSNQENTHHENETVEMNERSTQIKMNKLADPTMKSKEAPARRRSHECSVCQKGFDTPSKLSRHFLIHTGARPFKCTFCTKAFRQVWHRRNHERTHTHTVTPYADGQRANGMRGSPETYPSEHGGPAALSGTAHPNGPETDAHARDDPGPCGLSPDPGPCGLSPDPRLVADEAAPHADDTADDKCVDFHGLADPSMDYEDKTRGLYQCPECHSVYPTPAELASHLEVHWRVNAQDLAGPSSSSAQPEPSSSAHGLGMSFPTGRALDQADGRQAFQRHGGPGAGDAAADELPLQAELHYRDWNEPLLTLQCNKCLRSFETERLLQLHKCAGGSQAERAHANQYQCAICFKNFVSPSKLKRHYVTHTGQRPYECEVCVKTFTQLSHLKTHRHRSHKQ